MSPDKRPDQLPGKTEKIKVGCGHIFVTLNHRSDERYNSYPLNEILLEVSFDDKEALSCCKSFLYPIARLLTFVIRYETPENRDSFRASLVKTLHEHGCPKRNVVSAKSCVDAVGRALLCYWKGHKFKNGRCWVCGVLEKDVKK